mgnify:CR=1 FL=1
MINNASEKNLACGADFNHFNHFVKLDYSLSKNCHQTRFYLSFSRNGILCLTNTLFDLQTKLYLK